ncbi:TetR family transcriptional regulator [Agrobacterium vitis]|nr:TetR family transcriptional regulator [Agrobacterium vitis]
MGRRRIIDQQAILDAAERVVGRDGAANMTVDAVAREAGVSKASVLYDYKSKQALIEAVVDRAFQRDNEYHTRVEHGIGNHSDHAIRARIVAAAEPPPKEFRAVALNLSAALTLDATLRTKMQSNQTATIERILRGSKSPRGALLAYLALEGLKLLEHLDFHHFAHNDRSTLIREINWLVTAEPQAIDLPESPGARLPRL